MNAICNVGIAPIRKTFSEGAEMVSQMLYGETCSIHGEESSFYRIKMDFDQYEGWVDKLQIKVASDSEPERFILRNTLITNDNLKCVIGAEVPISLIEEHQTDKEHLLIPGTVYTRKEILEQALKYMNTPYLWGGRSPFGIDCSGLSQLVYKTVGIPIPRDTSQQIGIGKSVKLAELRDGDLAYFSKPGKQRVSHVGLVIEKNDGPEVLHASGWVKIESLTEEGIRAADGKLTHCLLEVRSVIT